jgi:hypothetical protein
VALAAFLRSCLLRHGIIAQVSRPVIRVSARVPRILQLQAGALPDLLYRAEGSRPALPQLEDRTWPIN